MASNVDLIETLQDKLDKLLSITEPFKNEMSREDRQSWEEISAYAADLRNPDV